MTGRDARWTESRRRSWPGFDARLYHTSGGSIEHVDLPVTNVTMNVGRSVYGSWHCERPPQRRLRKSGEIDVVPAGYAATWKSDGPALILSVDLKPAIMRDAAVSLGVIPGTVTLAPRFHLRDLQMQHILLALKAELELGEPTDRLFAQSLGSALALHLLRRYGGRNVVKAAGLARKQWHALVDHIDDHIATELSVARLAALVGMRETTFKTRFKRSAGVAVHCFVVRRRVDRAADLLARGRLTLHEIAVQSGFVDQSHMARWFRRLLGMTPAQVARQSR